MFTRKIGIVVILLPKFYLVQYFPVVWEGWRIMLFRVTPGSQWRGQNDKIDGIAANHLLKLALGGL